MWCFTDHTDPASDTAGFYKKKTCRCAPLWLSLSQAAALHELHTTPGSWALAYISPKQVEITRKPVSLSSIKIHAWRETLLPWAKAGMDFFTSPIVFSTLKSSTLSFARLYQTFPCLDDWNEPNQETETGIVQKYENWAREWQKILEKEVGRATHLLGLTMEWRAERKAMDNLTMSHVVQENWA